MPTPVGQPEKFTEVKWQEFMSEPRGLYVLGQALTDRNTFDEAVNRILHIVLSPNFRKLPFTVKLEEHGQSMLNESLRRRDQWLKSLSRQNSEQAAAIIGSNISDLKGQKGEESEIARRQLINLIPFVIPNIRDESVAKLLEQFDINALINVMDGSYPRLYDPLENLFLTEGVLDAWKMVIAKGQVHPQIEAEKPKKGINWRKVLIGEEETLAVRYARILENSRTRKRLDPGIFVEELRFLLYNSQFLDKLLASFSGNFLDIMNLCKEIDPKIAYDFFEAFVRHQRFTVRYEDPEKLAKEMLNHFIGDSEITAYLLKELRDYELRKINNAGIRESNEMRMKISEQKVRAIRKSN